jgi:ATP-dependent DNA helicase RecG
MLLCKSDALNEALALIGIKTPVEVLKHLPRRYENYEYTLRKDVYEDKERIVALGKLRGVVSMVHIPHRLLTRFYFETTSGEVFLIEAWNRNYLGSFLKTGELYTLSGVYEKRRHSLALINLVKGEVASDRALKPVYALPQTIPNHVFASLVKRCLVYEEGKMGEIVPEDLRQKYKLTSRLEAFRLVHEPTGLLDVHNGLRVLKYEEALLFELRNQLVRGANKALRKDRRRTIDHEKLERFISSLPYRLSADQSRSLFECVSDMDSPSVMYRLLQGDVGTGKTLVAALCAYANHLRSEQTALMAPTDALARQHYDTLRKLFQGSHLEIGLLVGSLTAEERHNVMQDLEDGTIDLLIGTHSLFSKGVNYAYLGLAIIDEQHKFGVNQRTLLLDKGEHTDLLLMSATPIPRTLTLTIYGDLDVSTLTEFPAGERHVKTEILDPESDEVPKLISAAVESGRRVYIVVPQIEGEEEGSKTSVKRIYEKYEALYPNKVTMMHGRMDEESKNVASIAFRTGLCPILVATSLIEVGIDVKEANTMIIYSPTHFALSSLHQLRGRIGRDGSPAVCVLASSKDEDEEGLKKLDVLLTTDDGFKIAEEDLKLRGPGDIIGVRQSGLPDFAYANIIDDFKIFECARDDAAKILKHQGDFENAEILGEVGPLVSGARLS